MSKRILAFLQIIAIGFVAQATAGNVKLSGKIIDELGAGISGVVVAIKDSNLTATTDEAGKWSIVRSSTSTLLHSSLMRHQSSKPGLIYNLLGRKMEDVAPAPGTYVTVLSRSGSEAQIHSLAKTTSNPDSLIVSYKGSVVGRMEQVNLLAGKLSDMILRSVTPLLDPPSAGIAPSSFYILVGQTANLTYEFDESIWRPTWLNVGETQIAAQGHDYSILLDQATGDVELELVTRNS